jgi:hypothetical protein
MAHEAVNNIQRDSGFQRDFAFKIAGSSEHSVQENFTC